MPRATDGLGDDLTASDDPTRKMMRQIAGAFAEYEKARLVSKLRHARDSASPSHVVCSGRSTIVIYRASNARQRRKTKRATRNTEDIT